MSSPARPPVVLFDGLCRLCDAIVGWLIPRDARGRLRFAPMQGPYAQAALARHGRRSADPGTLVVLRRPGDPGEAVLDRGRAAWFVASRLDWPWRLAAGLALLPGPLLDGLYDFVARRRYRWFGRREACRTPRPGEEDRFLAEEARRGDVTGGGGAP